VLTAALADLAGNPLASPPTLAFFTADVTAPGAPTLSPSPPRALCAPALTLAGAAEAGAIVRVQGGAAAAEVRADETGHFSVDVQLVPEGINGLRLNAVDSSGNVSDALLVQVIADCTPPSVVSADRQGSQFRIVFSEAVTAASVASAVQLSSSQGAVAGSVSLGTDGRTATFTPSGTLPSGALRLDVSAAVRDLAGNVMAFPWSQVFGAAGGDGFVSGTVIDDATGRPLAGAKVEVVATNGTALSDPRPEQVTGADGRFRIAVPAGTHDLTISRAGYTPGFRVTTTTAGQGIDIFDPRLTPAALPQTIGAAGGTAGTAPAPLLTLPAGALSASTPIAVTALSEQGLPSPLPYGWSPRGAVWLDLAGAPLLAQSTLSLPVESPDGTSLAVVHLDLATLQWRVVDSFTVAAGRVSITLPAAAAALTDGGYAALEADAGATAPPAAVAGAVLGGSSRPSGDDVTSATLSFNPQVVLPGQTSLATTAFTTTEDVASGLPLTLVVEESLTLLDESSRLQAPYQADLILYHAPGGAARSRFLLRPSDLAQTLPLKMGAEDVTLRTYGDAVAGNVVGADGGTIADAEGDRIDLPAGAVADPTAVTLTRKAAQDLPLALPAGTELAGVVELDLGGRGLLMPGALALALAPAPASGDKGLLLQVVDLEAGPAWRPVAALTATATGWSTAAIDPADLPWPGARDQGLYAFVRLTSALGYLRGTVHDLGGAALAGGRVRGTGVSWLQITTPDGRYVLPAPVSTVNVTAEDPSTGNLGAASAAIPAADARVDLDITLAATGPHVVEIAPADGAADVLQGIQPTVRFSKAIDAASVTGAVQLLQGGGPVAIDLDVQGGTLLRVTPRATLLPETAYELRVSTAVRDLVGNPLDAPASATFTTRRLLQSTDLDLTRVFLVEPDANGNAQVIGHAGAVPAGSLVFVENRSALANTPSVTAGTDGTFSLSLQAALTHRLVLHVLIAGSNEVVTELTPFHTADLKGAWVSSAEVTFLTGDGVTVHVPDGAFVGPTRVRLEPQPLTPPASPVPTGMAAVYNFQLDFGGAQAQKPLQISIPKPTGAPDAVEGVYLLNRMIVIEGKTYWMLHDLMRLDATTGLLTTELPPAASAASAARATAVVASLDAPFQLAAAQPPAGPAITPKAIVRTYKSYVVGSSFPGQYQVEASQIPLGYTVFPTFDMNFAVGVWNLGMEGMATSIDQSVERLLEGDGILIPTRLNQPYTIDVRNLSTSYLLSHQTYPAPTDTAFVELSPDVYGDKIPPLPIDGTPVRFIPLNFSGPSEQEVANGITARLDGSRLTVTGKAGSTHETVDIRLIGLNDSVDISTTSDSAGGFTLNGSAKVNNVYLLAIGARIATDRPLDITFSEALPASFPGIKVIDDAGNSLEVDKDPIGTNATVRIQPKSGWRAGKTYTLQLGADLADPSGNAWKHQLDVQFTVPGSTTIGTFNLPPVHDLANLGSWLFAATDSGVMVLDASDPANIRNVLPGNLAIPFPYLDAVRGVAVDSHGRVIVAGGGDRGQGQLKILDPLALNVEGINANPSDVDLLLSAYKGSTIISDKLGGTGTQLPSGLPQHVALWSNDKTDSWSLGGAAPAGLTLTPNTFPSPPPGSSPSDFTLTVQGANGRPGRPITLHDVTRERWNRVTAGADGSYTVTLPVQTGDQLEVLSNQDSIAYVATSGVGLEIVDVNSFFNEDHSPVQSDVLGIYNGLNAGLSLCGQPVADIGGTFTNLDTLFDTDNANPLTLVGLVGNRGFLLLRSTPESPGNVSLLGQECTQIDGSEAIRALTVLQHYIFDLNGDGKLDPTESRDYVLVAHQDAGILIYDITDRTNIKLTGRIRMPGPISALSVDRDHRRLFVAGGAAGFYVVDLNATPSLDLLDQNRDGQDDRVLETVALPGNTNVGVHLAPDLGLGFSSGTNRGVSTVAVGHPDLEVIAHNAQGKFRRIERVAPFGVPTAKENTNDADSENLPGSFLLQASLPGLAGDEVTLRVVGVTNSTGDELSCLADELPTSIDVTLHRMADKPWEPGYEIYRSQEISALADPRASRSYDKTDEQKSHCTRCDQDAENVAPDAIEVLSGDYVRIEYPDNLRNQLQGVYSRERLDEAEVTLKSVRWEMVPADRQENRHGSIKAEAPGLQVQSGEVTHAATDISIRGRGFDFALRRTYRNQTIGAGPFGPGWDFNYDQRLRELPDGKVELYDGQVRRETFEKQQDGTLKAPTGLFVTLERVGDGWVMIDPHHFTSRFDGNGRLISIDDAVRDSDQTGNEMTFFYDAAGRLVRVHDTLDRDILFEHRADSCAGEISKITDFDGREFTYDYDDQHRLVSMKTPEVTTESAVGDSQVTQLAPLESHYTYEASSGNLTQLLGQRDNLTSISDPKGQNWLQVTYTDAHSDQHRDQMKTAVWGGGNIQVQYDFGGHQTTVTDPRGQPFSYTYSDQGQVTSTTDPAGATTTYTYDAEGLPASLTDPYGRVTSYSYDQPCGGSGIGQRRSRGNLTKISVTPGEQDQGPNGSSSILTTCMDYEAYSNQLTQSVDPRGITTKIFRSEVGLPMAITEAADTSESASIQTSFNDYGQPTQVINQTGHTTQFLYGLSGYLETVLVDPFSLALATHYQTDARGNVISMTDPRGVTYTRSYNALNWITETRRAVTAPFDNDKASALDYATAYFYDVNGNLTEEFLPYGDGSSFTRRFFLYDDLDQLVESGEQVTPGQELGEWPRTYRFYDDNRNLTKTIGPDGQVTLFEYDQRNLPTRAVHTFDAADNQPAIQELFSYDLERRRTSYVDGRGGLWITSYDGYGRVGKTVDPLGNFATVVYDNANNPIETRAYQVPAQAGGDPTLLAWKTAQYNTRNLASAITQKLWQGVASGDTHDVTTHFQYNGVSNLIRAIDPLNRETTLEYDHSERLIATTDAAGNRTELDLDRSGRPVTTRTIEVQPVGGTTTVTTTATYDALGRLATSVDGLGNVQAAFYDARNNLQISVDPENFVTERSYDGLDRLIREVKPEGISVDYGYDKSSRLISYKDALGQETTYTYDATGRRTGVRYADGRIESYVYDGANNLQQVTDSNGSLIAQTFDASNRLTGRSVARGNGVIGPTSESYAYDGLGRLKQASSGTVSTQLTFDSLSRLVAEQTAGRDVTYALDDVGNPTRIQYPSGFALSQTFDPLNRATAIDWASNSAGSPFAHPVDYAYRGPGLVASEMLSNGLTGTRQYDAARRLLDETLQTATGQTVFRESLAWTPRGLKAVQTRGDLNGEAKLFAYDGASRLLDAGKAVNPSVTNNTVVQAADLSTLPDASAFSYDAAQNLLSRVEKKDGIPETIALPLDNSKRNRPAAVGSEALAWDANGNLISKGDLRFEYDFRNRLTRVSRSTGEEVATYQYDAFNRRTEKTVGTETYDTAWRGWQPIEEYHNGAQLNQRRIYGLSLDEMVQVQTSFNGGSQPGQVYVPLYDSTGNLTVMTGSAGKPIERYEYTPYGERKIFVGSTLPAVDQVRVKDAAVWVEMSEGVSPDALAKALTAKTLKLTDATHSRDLDITLAQPIITGPEANRRLVISFTGSAPAPQTQVHLTLPAAALVDSFLNQPAQDFELTFAWPEGDAVVQDTKAIQLQRVTVRDGYLEVGLSEEPDLTTLTAILIDGAPTTWILEGDRYTLKSVNLLPQGTHTFAIATTLADLNGGTLAQAFTASVSVGDRDNKSLFEAADPRETSASAIGNFFGFKGLPIDPETGLVCMRNRYYDPEMGRFITADPLGFAGGPSAYAFGNNNTINNSDPLGLLTLQEALKDKKLTWEELGKLELTPEEVRAILGSQSSYVAADPTDPKAAEKDLASAKHVLFFNTLMSKTFKQFVDRMYGVLRGLNPIHYAAEAGYAIGGGHEFSGAAVDRKEKGLEFLTYLVAMKGTDWVLGKISVPESQSSVPAEPREAFPVKDRPRMKDERLGIDYSKGGSRVSSSVPDGEFIWVELKDGSFRFAERSFDSTQKTDPFPHPMLSRGADVIGAGEGIGRDGMFTYLNARSGHFQPSLGSAGLSYFDAMQRGLLAPDAIFDPTLEGPRMLQGGK
jgi:RHS repeat-associated protein